MVQKGLEIGESYKILVLGFLLAFCLLITYYFHFILINGIFFTHLFYVPLILACLWWPRKGIVVAYLSGTRQTLEANLRAYNKTLEQRVEERTSELREIEEKQRAILDGIGIPDEVDIYTTDSLGLKLVTSLVQQQLKGEIQVIRDKGTEFIVDFKLAKEEGINYA